MSAVLVQQQALGMAGLLAYLRANGASQASIQLAETLMLVAGGHDSVDAITEAMGCSEWTTRRNLNILRGRGNNLNGKYKPSALLLVDSFRHPHQKGATGYRMSATGAALLQQALGGADNHHHGETH